MRGAEVQLSKKSWPGKSYDCMITDTIKTCNVSFFQHFIFLSTTIFPNNNIPKIMFFLD